MKKSTGDGLTLVGCVVIIITLVASVRWANQIADAISIVLNN